MVSNLVGALLTSRCCVSETLLDDGSRQILLRSVDLSAIRACFDQDNALLLTILWCVCVVRKSE